MFSDEFFDSTLLHSALMDVGDKGIVFKLVGCEDGTKRVGMILAINLKLQSSLISQTI